MASLPEEEITVKMSLCKKCTGWVRAAIEHEMTIESKKNFYSEAMKFDLDIKTVSLIEYRSNKYKFCNCK